MGGLKNSSALTAWPLPMSPQMRPDQLERRLRERLDALGPAPRTELLHGLMLPDFERVGAWHDLRSACDESGCPGGGDYILERRLTSQGIDLITSGADLTYIVPTLVRGDPVDSDLPDSAWAEVTARPYAPPRYSVCFEPNGAARPGEFQALDPATDLVPAPAKDLLDGSDQDPVHPGCLVLSTEDARAFYEIMSDAGFDPAVDHGDITPGSALGAWLLGGAENIYGEEVGIYLHPLWPDGEWHHLESG